MHSNEIPLPWFSLTTNARYSISFKSFKSVYCQKYVSRIDIVNFFLSIRAICVSLSVYSYSGCIFVLISIRIYYKKEERERERERGKREGGGERERERERQTFSGIKMILCRGSPPIILSNVQTAKRDSQVLNANGPSFECRFIRSRLKLLSPLVARSPA